MANKPTNSKTTKTAPAPAPKPAKASEQVEVKKEEKLPVATKPAAPPVEYDESMLAAMGGDSGAGVSTKAEDNIVPLIYILQAQSPQVLRQKAEFINGAKAGDFWFRGTKDFVDGETTGLEVVLCHFSKVWIEWKPDRGGFVMRHGTEKPEDAQWVADPKNPKRGVWEMPSGNIVVETREHVVIVVSTGEPYVLGLSGSNHGAARDWMSKCGRKRVPGTSNRAALWGYVWRLKTIPKSNDEGDWYGLQVEESLDDDGRQKLTWMLDGGETYAAARQLYDDFEAGVKQSDQGEEMIAGDADGLVSDVGGASDSDVM